MLAMSPSSPVTDCPLRRLEVVIGTVSKVQESSQLSEGLSLTIGNETPAHRGSPSLMLEINSGACRLVRLRLSRLLQAAHRFRDVVVVDKSSRVLSIRVPEDGQAVHATFENERHFRLTAGLLQRAGFPLQIQLGSQEPVLELWDGLADQPTRENVQPQTSSLPPMRLSSTTAQWQRGASVLADAPTSTSYSSPIVQTADESSLYLTPHRSGASLPGSCTLAASSAGALTQSFPAGRATERSISVDPRGEISLNPYEVFGLRPTAAHRPHAESPLRHSIISPEGEAANVPVGTPYTRTASHNVDSVQIMHRDFPSPSPLMATTSKIPETVLTVRAEDPNAGITNHKTESRNGFRNDMPKPRALPFSSSTTLPKRAGSNRSTPTRSLATQGHGDIKSPSSSLAVRRQHSNKDGGTHCVTGTLSRDLQKPKPSRSLCTTARTLSIQRAKATANVEVIRDGKVSTSTATPRMCRAPSRSTSAKSRTGHRMGGKSITRSNTNLRRSGRIRKPTHKFTAGEAESTESTSIRNSTRCTSFLSPGGPDKCPRPTSPELMSTGAETSILDGTSVTEEPAALCHQGISLPAKGAPSDHCAPKQKQKRRAARRGKANRLLAPAKSKEVQQTSGTAVKELIEQGLDTQDKCPPQIAALKPSTRPPPTDQETPPARARTCFVFTNTELVKRLNEPVFNLLNQYEADLARGADEPLIARYYDEQIDRSIEMAWTELFGDMDPEVVDLTFSD